MRKLTNARLVSKRLLDEWKLLSSVFTGILVAVTISVGSIVYLTALEQLAFRVSLDQISAPLLNLTVFTTRIPLTSNAIERMEEVMTSSSAEHIEELYVGHETFIRGASSIVGVDGAPLPPIGGQESTPTVLHGFFQALSNVENHAEFVDGRAPNASPVDTTDGITVEAMISEPVAEESKLGPGDSVIVARDVFVPMRITVDIVGVFRADDVRDDYWSTAAIVLTSQSAAAQGGAEAGFPPPDGVVWDTNQDLAIGLFVHTDVLTNVVGPANSGSLTNPIIFGKIDKARLGSWTASSFVERLDLLEEDIIDAMPGSTVSSGALRGLIDNVGRRAFFSRIPLLLLQTVMVVTVMFYMTMMVSYLARSRERDAALMRTRGVGIAELVRLYALEGAVMAAAALVIGAPIAFGAISLLGLVPPFRAITGGDVLLVRPDLLAFVIGAAVALACLLLYVLFGAAGARSGLLAQKMRAARPSTMSFFHRHYLDVGLVTIGGLVFWELQSREQIVSSGLFTELQVNETLLFGPILFLIVVALFFMRFFPILVRYIAGESAVLTHILAALSVGGLVGGGLYLTFWGGQESVSSLSAAIVLAAGCAYYLTDRFRNSAWWWLGIAVQTASVSAYVFTAGGIQADGGLLFIAEAGLLSIVPAQLLYRLLSHITRSAPVWLSISLWHMARNPLQYTWLVLLLVLVTGLGIFATTVGGTLTRSQEDQVQFDTPTDIRIQGRPLFLSDGLREMRDRFVDTPAVSHGALGHRASASIGSASMQLLALEPGRFAEVGWFREDFADTTIEELMARITVDAPDDSITLPPEAQSIGLWLKPLEYQPLISIWVVVRDANGEVRTISLGEVGETNWHKASNPLPDDLARPLDLMAVTLYEPGAATQNEGGGTPGTIIFDDIHVTLTDGSERILEGFEGENVWSPIPTSALGSDVLYPTADDPFSGARSGLFTFGTDRNRSIRGIYYTKGGGVIPVIISQGAADITGLRTGIAQVVNISGWQVPIEVAAVIDLFPTLPTTSSGFLIADLDALLTFMNIMSQLSTVEPNELHLQKSGLSPEIIEEISEDLSSILLKVSDRTAELEEIRLDPLQNTGWRALVLVALVVAALSAVFGYVAYMLLVGEQGEHELGFLQSLGLSRLQLLGLLGFEHLTIAALGLGVGTWAGFQMSRLMVAPLAVSDIGQPIIPPFILITDWSMMIPTYAAIIAVFVTTLFILYRSIGRTKLFELARGAET